MNLQINEWDIALLTASRFVLFYSVIAYIHVRVLIPLFFNKNGIIWYITGIAGIIFLAIYLFAYTELLYNIDFKLQFFTEESGNEVAFSRSSIQFKTTITAVTSVIVLISSFVYKLAFDYMEKQKQEIILIQEKTAAELKFLKNQINPHFFLNALNSMYSMSRLSSNKLEPYIIQLADMMRYVTYECNKPTVSLLQEVEYIQNYIFFQEIKDDKFNVAFEHVIENNKFQIEPMLLMPFVENAFKHSYNLNEDSNITIKIIERENIFEFHCINKIGNKLPKNNDPNYSGVGIDNVKQRLEARYKKNFSLDISSSKLEYKVSLKITDHGKN